MMKSALSVLTYLACTLCAGAETVTLTDMQGRKVELVHPVTRSVTIPMPAASIFVALDGGSEHLAGMHPNSYRYIRTGILGRIFPGILNVRYDITRSGFAPNVETLLEISPDLVWQWGHLGEDLTAPLHAAGLPVATLLYGDETRAREWIRLMGIALGKPERARQLIDWREKTEREIRRVTEDIPLWQRPRVLYLTRFRPDYRATGKHTSFDFDIRLAGGNNVSAGLSGSGGAVNIEQIMQWDPEVILLNNFEAELTPSMIYEDPLWHDIDAVRHRRVYKIPAGGYFWDAPNQETPLHWQWLSMILQPSHFDWPLRDNITAAYQMLYDYSPSQSDINSILQVHINEKSDRYGRFSGATAQH